MAMRCLASTAELSRIGIKGGTAPRHRPRRAAALPKLPARPPTNGPSRPGTAN
jgi:hypothetical protein